MNLLLIFIILGGRVERLQTVLTEKVTLEVGIKDRDFLRLWQELERCHWEKERCHWIIMDSLIHTEDIERIDHFITELRKVDSIYTERIITLQESLFHHFNHQKIDRFITIRKKLGPRLKALIREIKSGAD
ncbi:hypothetical protein DRP53_02005 [candidate division WOR-3 bacterium]|uniref:Uncharacterized protein n=1 Tax=candidate division WOR-3 bacterium TaxID=2052148 RepID=A0A660SKN4_UNCW3|nr:MAG: hypothetical protein DRP53_02005 [candidate division WOR-3 bacterium]